MKTVHRNILDDEYIADAQRLTIAQNWMLRFMYQTWWTWWLPRIAFLGGMAFLVHIGAMRDAVIVGLFLLLTIFGEVHSRWTLARRRRRFRSKGTTTTVTMDDDGIRSVGALGESNLKWKAVLKAAILPHGVLFQLTRMSWVWLPDRTLVEGTPGDVRQLLDLHVKTDDHR